MSEDESLRQLVDDMVGSVALDATGPDNLPPLWNLLLDNGLTMIGIDEEHGGSGGSLADLATVVRALGSHGVGSPLVEVATAAWMLNRGVGDGPDALAVFAAGTPQRVGNEIRIPRVPWARHAEAVLTFLDGDPVRIPLRGSPVAIRPGVSVAGEPSDTVILDASDLPITLADTRSQHAVAARYATLQSAATVGAIRGAYEMTSQYVKSRHQFGGPLVDIPAVAAGLGLIRTQVLLAEAALNNALAAVFDGPERTEALAAAARVVTAQAGSEAARLSHQLHGAMGVTKEYTLHRLTTHLWAWRDAGMSQSTWSTHVGTRALEVGELDTWNGLTTAT